MATQRACLGSPPAHAMLTSGSCQTMFAGRRRRAPTSPAARGDADDTEDDRHGAGTNRSPSRLPVRDAPRQPFPAGGRWRPVNSSGRRPLPIGGAASGPPPDHRSWRGGGGALPPPPPPPPLPSRASQAEPPAPPPPR